ncbi:MAG: hypothetical protein ACRBDI_05795 [Alphaproteobacteria bacterium]
MKDNDTISGEFESKGALFAEDVGRHAENGFVWLWAAAMNVPAMLDNGLDTVSLPSFGMAVAVTNLAMSAGLAVVNTAERDTKFKSEWQKTLLAGAMSVGIASGVGVVAADVSYDVYDILEDAYEMHIEN